jgi:excisionase family DNA binding protein
MADKPEPKVVAVDPLSITDAAQYLGVSYRTIQRLVALRQIEFIRIGRLTKITKRALDDYRRRNTFVPHDERKRGR